MIKNEKTNKNDFPVRRVIFKCDDFRGLSPNVLRFDEMVSSKKIKITWGCIGSHLNKMSPSEISWMQKKHYSHQYEFWNHGWTHLGPNFSPEHKVYNEFGGNSFVHQIIHLYKTQKYAKKILGFKFRTFGAPANEIDKNTKRALFFIPEIKGWFYGYECFGKYVFKRTADIEFPFFYPSFEKFKISYNSVKNPDAVVVLMCHPNMYDDARFMEIEKILDYLIQQNVEFVLPRDIYNDNKYKKGLIQ